MKLFEGVPAYLYAAAARPPSLRPLAPCAQAAVAFKVCDVRRALIAEKCRIISARSAAFSPPAAQKLYCDVICVSFSPIGLQLDTFLVTAVTVVRNGYTSRSHALYVRQGCQAACLTRIGSVEWRLVYSSAAVFTDLSLRPSTVPMASVAPFDYD